MNNKLIDTALTFRNLLRAASEKEIDVAIRKIAALANNSQYGQSVEPLQNLCGAMTAELLRRGLDSEEVTS